MVQPTNPRYRDPKLKFAEVMSTDPSRLVVQFQRAPNGDEKFQWGIAGCGPAAPLLSMIGALVRVQAELPLLEPGDPRWECPEPVLVVVWDAAERQCIFFAHHDVPVESMVGMLETIKLTILTGRAAQQAAAQSVRVLGSDGSPMRR